jgi:hypothetical protein
MLLLLFCFRHVRLDGTGPDGGALILMPYPPAFAQSTIFEINREPPFTIQQIIKIWASNRARQRIDGSFQRTRFIQCEKGGETPSRTYP